MKILVTTGNWNAALVVMKSLARKGHQIYLLDHDEYCAGFRSKYCSMGIVNPPESDKTVYVESLLTLLRNGKFDVLIPMSDHTTEFLSEERDRIPPHVRMLLPSKELIALARFKDKSYRFMLENNIPIPRTHFPQSAEDVERLADQLPYPCVVKKPRGSANRGNAYFTGKNGLVEYYRRLEEKDRWPVIQQYLDGDFCGFTAVVSEGEILDCFMYTAKQEYALNGTPPYGESTTDKKFFELVQRLIRLLKWHGAINLDFIKTGDGTFHFLEINPRLPGSLDFIDAAGLDFPALYLDLALGRADRTFKGFSYKPGLKFRFVLPLEMIYTLRNKRHLSKLLLNFFNPSLKTDIPWGDPQLLLWKLRHVWWYWRAKKHLLPLSEYSTDWI
ncbi:MAG: ATP-grasp domain-containing protein [Candidatus Omnitrophota bacterium]|nr:ATP-grasp domain-containing protein [Candidatus Omnitrophota bacterium]MDZ4242253.1 ATP-grasp domain-containing protein [Candidatus Omnitrophota bacterium]